MGGNSAEWAATMRRRLHLDDISDADIQRAIVDGVVERYRDDAVPRDPGGTRAVRRIAATRPVALASSSHPAVIAAAVDALGLHGVFGAVVSSDEVAEGKPAPDVYLRAASLLGVAGDRCLVIEDSLNGVRAGKAAGAFVVLVPNPSVPAGRGARPRSSRTACRAAHAVDPDTITAGDPEAARR